MKTIKVTLTKEGAQATCTLEYVYTDIPREGKWAGNHKAFRLSDGLLMDLSCSLERLPRVVEFQAHQCGATFQIEDLGGEAKR